MFRLFSETPQPLMPGHLVWFSKRFPTYHAGRVFRVVNVQTTKQVKSYIISAGGSYSFDITDPQNVGLKPRYNDTLYEIFVGINSCNDMLTYLQMPAGRYLTRLEESAFYPDYTNVNRRYISAIIPRDTPITKPKLRIHTVKDIDAIVFQIYNDAPVDMKIVYNFGVNICKLEPYEGPVETVRQIWHPEDIRVGEKEAIKPPTVTPVRPLPT